ncbi:hypothetical protein F4815DRAFT_485371 [Daldinia loculata]|nr:hypothetical protein F4815DRAFT_485371 [Daldinia loculata]
MIVKLTAISIWNLIEAHVGIIAASGPTLRGILAHVLPIDAVFSVFSFTRSDRWKRFLKPPSFVKIPRGDGHLRI